MNSKINKYILATLLISLYATHARAFDLLSPLKSIVQHALQWNKQVGQYLTEHHRYLMYSLAAAGICAWVANRVQVNRQKAEYHELEQELLQIASEIKRNANKLKIGLLDYVHLEEEYGKFSIDEITKIANDAKTYNKEPLEHFNWIMQVRKLPSRKVFQPSLLART